MSELRYNLLTREWVIIASERARRPHDFMKAKAEKAVLPVYKKDCPFCPGNEGDLSDETYRLGSAGAWRTRCVYNKYPALSYTVKEEREVTGPHKHISGYGIHEVIIEHPSHNTCLALMTDKEVEDVIRTYKARYDAVSNGAGIQAITIFKNHGPAAGTSQQHPHSQLVATPVVPRHIREMLKNGMEYYDIAGKCMFCRSLELELSEKARVVFETEHFVSGLPYAGSFPFAMLIIPRRHAPSFGDINEAEIKDLAYNLRTTLGKLYHGLGDPDFNFVIRSVPVREKWNGSFHWYLSIVPRLTNPAGFELGSGMFINASIPEESAQFLRQVDARPKVA